ncbi:hypothetical protein JCM24511_09799 [Saitozyma sp. JCM 24511]|nr:hypothetical protein JCM24511_09799 [Saitozyma sp. JCM 24511]
MSQLPSSQLPGLSSQASRSAAVRAGPSTTRIEESPLIDDPIESFSKRHPFAFDSTSAESKSSRKRKQSPDIAEEAGSEQDAEGEVDDFDTIDMLEDSGGGSWDRQRGDDPPSSKRMRSSRGVHDVDVTRKTDWDM